MRETTIEKHRKIQRRFDEIAEKQPELSAGEIYEIIGKEFYMSAFTIQNICNNPIKSSHNLHP